MGGKWEGGRVILEIRGEGLAAEGFHRQAVVLALPEHHPLAGKAVVELSDLDRLPLVVLRGDLEPRFGEDLKRIFGVAPVQARIFSEATTQAEAPAFGADEGETAFARASAGYLPPAGPVLASFSA